MVYIRDIVKLLYENDYQEDEYYDNVIDEKICVGSASMRPTEVHPILFDIVAKLVKYHHEHKPYDEGEELGTFLIFLPGTKEISEAEIAIRKHMSSYKDQLEIMTLNSETSDEQHLEVFNSPKLGVRRVILSTNIAESSITLIDVRFIVDFALANETRYDTKDNTEKLELVWASKSVMIQRCGRAGRVAGGVCYRLITGDFYEYQLYRYAKPEIQRCSLDKLVLKLKQLNLGNPKNILKRAMDAPDEAEIRKTEVYLQDMGGLNCNKDITHLGRLYADMPCDLKVTRLCIFGMIFQCMNEALVIGSILNTSNPPILSLHRIPYLRESSKVQIKAYFHRLLKDNNDRSDLIAYLNAFLHWYDVFGRKLEQDSPKLKSIAASTEEDAFCDEWYYDSTSMRGILRNYQDIKEVLSSRGMDDMYLHKQYSYQSSAQNTEIIEKLKFCIAACFIDKFIKAEYKIVHEENRNELIRKIGGHAETSVLIPAVQDLVQPNDIFTLLKPTVIEPMSIHQVSNNLVVNYPPGVDPRALKMALWIGNNSNRYNLLTWFVCKKTLRQYGHLLSQKTIQDPKKVLSSIPVHERRDGRKVQLNPASTDDHEEAEEFAFVARPENPFQLKFFDLLSRYEIRITEESVNHIILEPDAEEVKKMLLVATDYFPRNEFNLAKNTTVMPTYPLFYQVFCLIFSRYSTFQESSKADRYDSFKVLSAQEIVEFDYEITGKDIEEINEIRRAISESMWDPDYMSNLGVGTDIYSKIKTLLTKHRTPIDRDLPDWQKLTKYQPQHPTHSAFSECSDSDSGAYLRPLLPLHLSEDAVHWDPQREKRLEEHAAHIKLLKQQLLDKLERRSRLAFIAKTMLICKECGTEVCTAESLELVEGLPGLFVITPIYGALEYIAPDAITAQTPLTVQATKEYVPEAWVVCINQHPVGWEQQQTVYISPQSPLQIAFPTLKLVNWEPQYWESDFCLLSRLSAEYESKYSQMRIEKFCPVCQEEFVSNSEFSNHITLSESHKRVVQDFLKSYIF